MSRYLFVVPPMAGHVLPAAVVARALERHGHTTAWVSYEELLGPLLHPGARIIPASGAGNTRQIYDDARAKAAEQHGFAALEFLYRQVLMPMAVDMQPGVEAAVESFEPDALVVDMQAFAGAATARKLGMPWVTSATTWTELTGQYDLIPKVGRWVHDQLVDLQCQLGLDAETAARGDLRFSDQLTLCYTTKELAGPPRIPDGVGPVVLVGALLPDQSEPDPRLAPAPDFPWDWWRDPAGEPKAVVSLGSLYGAAGERFLRAALEAVTSIGLRAVIVAPPEVVGETAENVVVRNWIPQLSVLESADVVVCHAGQNTVTESLAHGVPLVMAPMRDDQPAVADKVVQAGAGIRLRYKRAQSQDVLDAVTKVLDDPGYRVAARRIGDSFAHAGGADEAARLIEQLA